MSRDRHAPPPSEEEKARRLALMKRLQSEGRSRMAGDFREEVRKACRQRGLTPADSVLTAWAEMERNYPPLKKSEQPAAAATVDEPPEPVSQDHAPVVVAVSGPNKEPDKPIWVRIPPEWGELPKTAKRVDEVEWVHQNWFLCREVRPSGTRTKLSRAQGPAPSWGAVGLMETTVMNPQKFENEVYAREMKGTEEDEDGEAIKREKKSIAEIDTILQRMEEAV